MMKQLDGFIKVDDGKIEKIQFCDIGNGIYRIKTTT